MQTLPGTMWPHAAGDGRVTAYHDRAPAVGRLCQHRGGLPPVSGTTGTGLGLIGIQLEN